VNTHPTDDELLASIDAGTEDRHLSTCAQCRDRRGEFEATLAMASHVSEVSWTTQQSEALIHGVRRRLHDRRGARRPVWQPALGGALFGGVLAALLLVLLPPDLAQGPVLDEGPVQDAVVVDSQTANAQDLIDDDQNDDQNDEIAAMIEMYLIETSSADELLLALDELSDDEYYALLDE